MKWFEKGDPLGAPRNPLAIYLLLLALVSGLGMMFGLTTARGVEESVPAIIANTWGGILFFGSAATLTGMFWQGDVRTGLLMKRTGTFTVGVGASVYSAIVVSVIGIGALFAGGITLGFGIACFFQFHAINKRIHQIIKATP